MSRKPSTLDSGDTRLDRFSYQIIGAAISVHRTLGPGLLESVYEVCMEEELTRLGLSCLRQLDLPITYRGRRLQRAYRLDLLVEDCVVVEVKAVDALKPVHRAQLMTYLRLSKKRLGLLINFQERTLVDGVRRLLNGFDSPPRAVA